MIWIGSIVMVYGLILDSENLFHKEVTTMAQIRRYIFKYYRYNPQLGVSIRKGEVYETTLKKAERTAIRHCNDYTAYGTTTFKQIIQVSEPIVLGVDVEEVKKSYGEWPHEKTYTEYRNLYPKQNSVGWDKLKEV